MADDVRDRQKVATLPAELKSIADQMIGEKFGLAVAGEVEEKPKKARKKSVPKVRDPFGNMSEFRERESGRGDEWGNSEILSGFEAESEINKMAEALYSQDGVNVFYQALHDRREFKITLRHGSEVITRIVGVREFTKGNLQHIFRSLKDDSFRLREMNYKMDQQRMTVDPRMTIDPGFRS